MPAFSVIAAALTLAFAMPTASVAAPPAAAPQHVAAPRQAIGCARPVAYPQGPFKIASNRRTVLNDNAKHTAFVSYGITVPGLSQSNFATDKSYVQSVVKDKDIPKIVAAATYWCANTVRLQVSQHDVTQNTTPDNGSCATAAGQAFLSQALDPEVDAAESLKMAVVINDQTESDPLANDERDPTDATFTFWNCVTRHKETWGKHLTYAQDPNVIFDIFNEPRADNRCSAHGPYDLELWRNGGTVPAKCDFGQPVYQGMDAVAYHIRRYDHATNLLWVEGPGLASTLAGLDHSCPPSPFCLLPQRLGPIVYAIHHMYVATAAQANSSTWWDEFGYLVDKIAPVGQAPVVVGEWTNADDGDPPNPSEPSSSSYCWPSAPASVQKFLTYLQQIGVGLNGYQLAARSLLKVNPTDKVPSSWTDTTNYTDRPWQDSYCAYTPGKGRTPPPLLGAGADILHFFRTQE